jgi:hypothetical protein
MNQQGRTDAALGHFVSARRQSDRNRGGDSPVKLRDADD